MVAKRNRIHGAFLLFCFAFTIVPVDSFHQHDWESEICNESESHFAEHSIDCELADLLITKILKADSLRISQNPTLLIPFVNFLGDPVFLNYNSVFQGRAPPSLA